MLMHKECGLRNYMNIFFYYEQNAYPSDGATYIQVQKTVSQIIWLYVYNNVRFCCIF